MTGGLPIRRAPDGPVLDPDVGALRRLIADHDLVGLLDALDRLGKRGAPLPDSAFLAALALRLWVEEHHRQEAAQ